MEKGVYDKYYDQGFKAKKKSDNNGHVPSVPWHRPHDLLGHGIAEMMAAPVVMSPVCTEHTSIEGRTKNSHVSRAHSRNSAMPSSPSGYLSLSDLSPCLLSSPYRLKLEGFNDLGAFITQAIKKSVDVYGAQFKQEFGFDTSKDLDTPSPSSFKTSTNRHACFSDDSVTRSSVYQKVELSKSAIKSARIDSASYEPDDGRRQRPREMSHLQVREQLTENRYRRAHHSHLHTHF